MEVFMSAAAAVVAVVAFVAVVAVVAVAAVVAVVAVIAVAAVVGSDGRLLLLSCKQSAQIVAAATNISKLKDPDQWGPVQQSLITFLYSLVLVGRLRCPCTLRGNQQ